MRYLIQELYIRKKCFTQIYRQLKRNAMLVPFSRKICHCVLPRKRKINLEFRRIKRNNSFSARTVQVNKTLSGNSSFGLRENLVEPHFNVTQRINLEIQHPLQQNE